ncbi:MAG: CpsD/CapB family tyrosine-protein kinase [Clostridia bacterium]|nr:CpsD/CapB family tyrosine-protein kinase [Clostridia bacterium]
MQHVFLITQSDPRSPASEAFRLVRANLKFSQVQGSFKTILITSTGPEEGKSTLAANLAVTMAQAGSTVLLVDCDLRRPRLHRTFKLKNRLGLTNVLIRAQLWNQAVQTTDIPGLSLIPSGPIPPNPSELLGSEPMQEFLESAASEYDAVVLDTPPVVAVSDALVLAPLVDGIILVVRAGKTRVDQIMEAKKLLENANGRIVGAVINAAKPNGKSYYYYHYYSSDGKER